MTTNTINRPPINKPISKPAGKPANKANNAKAHKINDAIRGKVVFLINQNGEKIGEVSIFEARKMAEDEGLDLVQVGQNENPGNYPTPVCKIMDYGRFCFDLKKNKSKAKKENKVNEIKELQIRPSIEENDFQVKVKKAISFIKIGHKVNLVLKYKGRQNAHPEIGIQLLEKFAIATEEVAKIESKAKLDGKRALMVLAPK